jgi:hypothetical protein
MPMAVVDAQDRLGDRGSNPVAAQKFTNFVNCKVRFPQPKAKPSARSIPAKAGLWYDGKITGFESHADAMLRRSTLATQSEIALAVERGRIYSESRRRLSLMSCEERNA